MEAVLDLRAMYATSTKVFLMEAMGRHTGWIALSGSLILEQLPDTPLLILFPERTFKYQDFLKRVKENIAQYGYCVVVVAEGIKTPDGEYFAVARCNSEHIGWSQMGGAAMKLADWLRRDLDTKIHAAVPDYLQRSAAHLVSLTDWEMAYDAGRAAVEAAVQGHKGVLPVITQINNEPFEWNTRLVTFTEVAEAEQTVPDLFITADGYHVTHHALNYLRPLVAGERSVPWHHGLPDLKPVSIPMLIKRLPPWPGR
jgi:6-phosphofructokinase 1